MALAEMNYKSLSLSREVSLVVFLPSNDGWANAQMPFRTLYFLPGYGAGARDTATLLSIRRWSMEQGIAVVIPDGENSLYENYSDKINKYSDFVGKEIIEVTRKIFPLSKKREDTFIGGYDIGSHGAVVNGLRYIENFSKIVLLLPVLDYYKLLDQSKPSFEKDFLDSVYINEESYNLGDKKALNALINNSKDEKRLVDLFIGMTEEEGYFNKETDKIIPLLKEKGCYIEQVRLEEDSNLVFLENMMEPMFSFLGKKRAMI